VAQGQTKDNVPPFLGVKLVTVRLEREAKVRAPLRVGTWDA